MLNLIRSTCIIYACFYFLCILMIQSNFISTHNSNDNIWLDKIQVSLQALLRFSVKPSPFIFVPNLCINECIPKIMLTIRVLHVYCFALGHGSITKITMSVAYICLRTKAGTQGGRLLPGTIRHAGHPPYVLLSCYIHKKNLSLLQKPVSARNGSNLDKITMSEAGLLQTGCPSRDSEHMSRLLRQQWLA